MSGVATIAAVTSVAALGYNIYAGERANNEQQKALEQQQQAQTKAQATAEAQAKSSEEAVNRASSKMPDTASIMSSAQQAASGGVGGTMLTGPSGIDPNSLSLGKKTLLGS